jgi:hypothetical protein
MQIVENFLKFLENRDQSLLTANVLVEKAILVATCSNLIDWLKLHCKFDRPRILAIDKGGAPYQGILALMSNPDFHLLFEFEESSYDVKLKFNRLLPEEDRLKCIKLVCENYKSYKFP